MRNEIKINLNRLDELSKVECLQSNCVHNLVMGTHGDGFYCNNKYIQIDEFAQCANFAERRKPEDV